MVFSTDASERVAVNETWVEISGNWLRLIDSASTRLSMLHT